MAKKKKPRTAAQKRATAKLVAYNKRKRVAKRHARKKPRTAAQRRATAKLIAYNKRRAAHKTPKRRKLTKMQKYQRGLKRQATWERRMVGRSIKFPKTLKGWLKMDPERRAFLQQELGRQKASSAAVSDWLSKGGSFSAAREDAAAVLPIVIAPAAAARKPRRALRIRRAAPSQLNLFGASPAANRLRAGRLKGIVKATAKSSKKRKANPRYLPGRPRSGKAWWIARVFTLKRKRPIVYVAQATTAEAHDDVKRLIRRTHHVRRVVLDGPFKRQPIPSAA